MTIMWKGLKRTGPFMPLCPIYVDSKESSSFRPISEVLMSTFKFSILLASPYILYSTTWEKQIIRTLVQDPLCYQFSRSHDMHAAYFYEKLDTSSRNSPGAILKRSTWSNKTTPSYGLARKEMRELSSYMQVKINKTIIADRKLRAIHVWVLTIISARPDFVVTNSLMCFSQGR